MFKDLLKKDRSVRGYDESYYFSKEELAELVDYTRYTPSSANIQPLKYHLVFETDEVKFIQQNTKWAGYLSNMTIPHDGKHPTAFIIICQDTDLSKNLQSFKVDVGIVAHTILLAATEKGFGGCMIGSFERDNIKEQLPENMEPVLVISLGIPDEEIKIVDADNDIKYYRDSNDVHYVPKRKLENLII